MFRPERSTVQRGLKRPGGAYRVRMQVLLLAQPVQERSLLLEERLPRREEHRAANVEANPLPVVPPVRVDNRAVTDTLRRRPAGFCRAGGGRGRALSRLAVFVVIIVVVIVVAVVVVAAVVCRQCSGVRRFPLVLCRRCHLGKKSSWTQTRYERGGPRTVASAFSLSYPTEHAPPPECPLKASWLSYRKLTTLCPRDTFKVKAVMAATEENNIF